jgi:hypothetical protein
VILGRDGRARQLDKLVRRESVTRHTLVRANALNCTEHVLGRGGVALTCKTCNGTGYLTGQRADIENLGTLGAPYNTLFFIFGEIQMGHGIRGSGGEYTFTDADRGTEFLGDAIFYFPANQREPNTGDQIAPVIGSMPRPDRIVRAADGQVFNVLHYLDESFGTSGLFKACALGIGIQGSAALAVPQ